MGEQTDTTQDINYVQTEYFCENCKTNHLGNCPKIKVTLTTSTHTDTTQIDHIESLIEIYGKLPTDANKQRIMGLIQSHISKQVEYAEKISYELGYRSAVTDLNMSGAQPNQQDREELR